MVGDFALNGLLGTYPLFLLSTTQWGDLLGPAARGRMLDVGAACGDVTERLASLVDSVTATEVNRPMVRRLRRRGIDAHHLDLTVQDPPAAAYDLVTALNVLDRCERPVTLLHRLADLVAPGGHLVVSVPLPYRPAGTTVLRSANPASDCRSSARIRSPVPCTGTRRGGHRLDRRPARTRPVLSGGTVAVRSTSWTAPSWSHGAADHPVPSAGMPNVLLVTLDQHRGDCLSAAGHPVVRTPHLDALAAEGVRFAATTARRRRVLPDVRLSTPAPTR